MKKSENKNIFLFIPLTNLWKANLLILVAICCMAISYLVQINNIATKGREIKNLENDIASMQEKNDKLHLSIIQAQSLAKVEAKIATMQLTPTERYEYLNIANEVAIK